MIPFERIIAGIDLAAGGSNALRGADALIVLGEEILENWVEARNETPTAGNARVFVFSRCIARAPRVTPASMPAGKPVGSWFITEI